MFETGYNGELWHFLTAALGKSQAIFQSWLNNFGFILILCTILVGDAQSQTL